MMCPYYAQDPGDVLPTAETDEERRRVAFDAVAWALHDEKALSTVEGFWVGSKSADGRTLVLQPDEVEIVENIAALVLASLNEHDRR